jgi:hypothetical protein
VIDSAHVVEIVSANGEVIGVLTGSFGVTLNRAITIPGNTVALRVRISEAEKIKRAKKKEEEKKQEEAKLKEVLTCLYLFLNIHRRRMSAQMHLLQKMDDLFHHHLDLSLRHLHQFLRDFHSHLPHSISLEQNHNRKRYGKDTSTSLS